jgi:hypothetical protein
MTMDRIVFGDNQFFGINHMSEEKARAQAIRFQETSAIIEVLDYAYAEGVRTFMCTTHERIAEICDHFRSNGDRYPGFQFYPCMPYAHKYANAVTDLGMLGALRSFLPESGALGTLIQGGKALATSDIESIGQLLIDAEMRMFEGLKTPVIFIQNVVTDLLLGLGMKDTFRVFADHVRAKYDAEPGFITMNVPMLLDTLDQVGIDNPIVCANINKSGFRMSGGIERYEEVLRTRRFRPMAMSVFASGAIPAQEALAYVCGLKPVESILFGASSRQNIHQTCKMIRQLSG